jgi:hypothetical protein
MRPSSRYHQTPFSVGLWQTAVVAALPMPSVFLHEPPDQRMSTSPQ